MTGIVPESANDGLSSRSTLVELRAAIERIERQIAAGAIVPNVAQEEIRAHLAARYSFREPMPLEDAAADVEYILRRWNAQVTHPRYFGLFNPSVSAASIIADALTAAYNPQLATWRTSPGANEIERHTLGWLLGKFGLPDGSFAGFTTGGAESNLSAVAAAMTRAFPRFGEFGLRQVGGQPAIYSSQAGHHSFEKIAHLTGLGRRAVRRIPTDGELKMDLRQLARRVTEDRKAGFTPFMVVGTAGTTSAGAIDRLPEIAAFCRLEGLWFHVDAAWGGAAVISPRLKQCLAGIAEGDSISCDAHKWFSVPMGAGMFFCRHPEAVRGAFHVETPFMPGKSADSTFDPYASSMQWSRRFIGLKLFLALAERGEAGYIEMIEHQARMGDFLRESLVSAGWQIVNSTPLPLVCFRRDDLDAAKLVAALLERQIAWMSSISLAGGEPVMRACITSFHTTERDIEQVVNEMTNLDSSAAGTA